MKFASHLRVRRLPATAVVAIAAASAVPAFAASTGHNHSAHSHGSMQMHAARVHALNAKQAAFHDAMRKLWEDHITWTRLAIVSFVGDLPDLSATQDRLLRNQTDIGNAIKPYYGRTAGNKLTALLKAHIVGAVQLLAAAKAGDQAAVASKSSEWNANGIAALLASVNPNWPLARLKAEMAKHLALTMQEAVARLQGKWAADVAAYDRVHHHILHMSDLLADGIVKQFPNRFREAD